MALESQAIREKRDSAIEHALCTFGLSFNAILSELYWGKPGAPVGNVLARLSGKQQRKRDQDQTSPQRIRIEKNLVPGRINLILPTESTTERLGYPKNRAVLPGTAGVNDRIAFACFCFLSSTGNTRWPVRAEQINQVYPDARLGYAPRVVTEEFDAAKPTILEIVYSVAALERSLAEREKTIGPHVASGDFGFAVLSCAAANDEAIINRKSLRSRATTILVEEAVTADTLSCHIKQRRRQK